MNESVTRQMYGYVKADRNGITKNMIKEGTKRVVLHKMNNERIERILYGSSVKQK